MVFEQLYSAKLIEQKSFYAFLMGLGYSIIGIATAIFLFGGSPVSIGLSSIAFTSLLIVPSLNKLFSIEAKQAAESSDYNFITKIFKNHADITKVYIFLFFGILLAYAFFSVVWEPLSTAIIFKEQVVVTGITGEAASPMNAFKAYISNNLLILLFILIASIIYGSGSIFLITWNASTWGTVFGIIAHKSAISAGTNPLTYFLVIFSAVFLHTLFEAGSYLLGALSGGILSKAIVREKLFSDRFNQIMQDALIIFILAVLAVIIGAYIEAGITPGLIKAFGLKIVV